MTAEIALVAQTNWLMSFVSGQCFFYIKLFKFFQGFAQHDVAVKHFLDYSFQSWSYLHLSLESAPKASRRQVIHRLRHNGQSLLAQRPAVTRAPAAVCST